MSSITLTLTGNTSQLQADYFPSIDLNDGNYVCGLIDFQTFNSIPNVDESNNLFYIDYEDFENKQFDDNEFNIEVIEINTKRSDKKQNEKKDPIIRRNKRTVKTRPVLSCIRIPTGSYEVEDLSRYLKKSLLGKDISLELEANKNTLQCEILCSQHVDFSKPNTIGPLLGFRNNDILTKNQVHVSPLPADILKINVIRVECNIVTGSFLNNKPSHTIHEFSPRVPPGYKIIEVPQNVIYFPVTVKNIHTISLSVIDQNNHHINFRGETITIRLHIKKSV